MTKVVSKVKTGEVTQTVSHESDAAWIRRLAQDLKHELPHLKTKVKVNGKTVLKAVNHRERMKKLMREGGHDAVLKYCKDAVAFYNQQIKKHKQGK